MTLPIWSIGNENNFLDGREMAPHPALRATLSQRMGEGELSFPR